MKRVEIAVIRDSTHVLVVAFDRYKAHGARQMESVKLLLLCSEFCSRSRHLWPLLNYTSFILFCLYSFREGLCGIRIKSRRFEDIIPAFGRYSCPTLTIFKCNSYLLIFKYYTVFNNY